MILHKRSYWMLSILLNCVLTASTLQSQTDASDDEIIKQCYLEQVERVDLKAMTQAAFYLRQQAHQNMLQTIGELRLESACGFSDKDTGLAVERLQQCEARLISKMHELEASKPQLVDIAEFIRLGRYPDTFICATARLPKATPENLHKILKDNRDIFNLQLLQQFKDYF